MKSGYTHIAVVLDRSGSMSFCASDTVGGFNTFVAEQKKAEGEATMTLTQFDTEYEIVYDFKNIQDVPNLTFVPRGNTALLDAIGRTIQTVGHSLESMPEAERPEKVIFVIITDGKENSSREFKKDQINQLIKTQTDVYKWEFVYLGANQDAIQEGSALGVLLTNALTFDTLTTRQVYDALSENVRNLRSAGSARKSMEWTEQQRKTNTPKVN
jgi:hypothetical protein